MRPLRINVKNKYLCLIRNICMETLADHIKMLLDHGIIEEKREIIFFSPLQTGTSVQKEHLIYPKV